MSSGGWTAVRVRPSADPGAALRALFSLGAEGVQELDGELITHLRSVDEATILAALQGADSRAAVSLEPTPDVDWSSAWRQRIAAHRVGWLIVTPPWLAHQFGSEERIVIEPAMAFGTGEHESTRGVLRLMQTVVRRGDLVADLGTGSGVLAIAAAKLGARHAAAIELDADAIANAEENVARNGVSQQVSVIQGDASLLLPLLAPVRVVLANIISGVLLQLLPVIRSGLAADGRAIIGGILLEEYERMGIALHNDGWRIETPDEEGQWWSAVIAPAWPASSPKPR